MQVCYQQSQDEQKTTEEDKSRLVPFADDNSETFGMGFEEQKYVHACNTKEQKEDTLSLCKNLFFNDVSIIDKL